MTTNHDNIYQVSNKVIQGGHGYDAMLRDTKV